MNDASDGFDLGPVLDWLKTNEEEVARRLHWLDQPGEPYPHLSDTAGVQLSPAQAGNVLSRFPQTARERSVLGRIIGKPATWFAVGTTADRPIPTEDPAKAMYPTAIAPGYTGTISWTREHKENEISLFRIPDVPDRIAAFMLAHTLIHEYTHTIINPMWFDDGEPYLLDVPHVASYEGTAFMRLFADEAARHPAISHYAAAYRPFPDEPDDKQFIRRVGEELCESVAAYLLGYIYCDDPERSWDPFADRPMAKLYVEHFLNGTRGNV